MGKYTCVVQINETRAFIMAKIHFSTKKSQANYHFARNYFEFSLLRESKTVRLDMHSILLGSHIASKGTAPRIILHRKLLQYRVASSKRSISSVLQWPGSLDWLSTAPKSQKQGTGTALRHFSISCLSNLTAKQARLGNSWRRDTFFTLKFPD